MGYGVFKRMSQGVVGVSLGRHATRELVAK